MQTLMKFHPLFDKAIQRILELDKKAVVLVVCSGKQQKWCAALRERWSSQLLQTSNSGGNVERVVDRVVLLPTLSPMQYVHLLALGEINYMCISSHS
jgi:hypothetical protein